jgi:hypothetical protein
MAKTKEPRTVTTDPRIVRLRAARDAAKKLAAARTAQANAIARCDQAEANCQAVVKMAETMAEAALLSEVMGIPQA